MKIKSAQFLISATDLSSCPQFPALPEFAFIGRSNVGKSSLINLLTEKRDLAKVSATPGKTRLINFFQINEAWHLVDLPGYGFAKVSKTESADFSLAVANYLEKRDALKCTFVLIDSMLPPQKIDMQFIRWMNECSLPYVLVFTKTDRQSPTATRKSIAAFLEVLKELAIEPPTLITSSAKNKDGRGEILKFIEESMRAKSKKRKAVVDTETVVVVEEPLPEAAPLASAKPAPKTEVKPKDEAAPKSASKTKAKGEESEVYGEAETEIFVIKPGKPRVWRP